MADTTYGAFSVSTMDDAIKYDNIKKKIVFSDDVTSEWEQLPSVSNSVELDLVSSDAAFSTAAVGWSGTTSVTITAKTISLTDLENETGLYKRTLEKKWVGKNMNHLQGGGLNPYTSLINDVITEPLTEEFKKAIWQGSTAFSNSLYYQLSSDTSKVQCAAAYTGTTGFNATYADIDDAVQAMIDAIPEKLAGQTDLKLYMSWSNFRLYINKVRDAGNRYQTPVTTGEYNNRYMVEGPIPVEIVATHGLINKDYFVLAPASNFVLAYLLQSFNEELQFWINFDQNEYRWRTSISLVPSYYDSTSIVCNF